MKKRVLALLFLLVGFLSFVAFFAPSGSFTGNTVYDGSNDYVCGSTVINDSNLTYNANCNDNSEFVYDGANITVAGIRFNCFTKILTGNSVTGFGIKTTADNIIIKSCVAQSFAYNVNLTGHNTLLVDSVISTGTKNIYLTPSKNGTLLNTTVDDAKIDVSTGANLFVQYYVKVNVTNSSGTGGLVANVSFFNESGYASSSSGTTGADGLLILNVTDRVVQNSATLNFVYVVNATVTGNTTSNNTVDLVATTGFFLVNIQTTEVIAGGSDTTSPNVTIISPGNASYRNTTVSFNLTAVDDIGVGKCEYSLNNGLNNFSMSNSSGSYNATNTSMMQGSHRVYFYCNDTTGNLNISYRDFVIDSIPPIVIINSPTNTSYSVSSYDINIGLNESGYCEYSLDNGATNSTLTSSGLNFTSSKSGVSNGDYNLTAYCNDSVGNRNDSVVVYFSVSVTESTVTPPGGGCSIFSWTCGNWSDCINENQTRTCRSNCGTTRTEKQSCSITIPPENRTTNETKNETENETIPVEFPKVIPSSLGNNGNRIIFVVSGGIIIILAGGIIWIFWIISLIPFFSLRLKHYIVALFDTDNSLNFIDAKGRLNKLRLNGFLKMLNEKQSVTFANKIELNYQFLLEKGFLELQLDAPVIVNAHFSNKKDAREYKEHLKMIMKKMNVNLEIIEIVEKASIFSLIREYSRRRKTEKQARKITK